MFDLLGMPRGGVPVAFEVAKALRVPLDVFVVRKLGVPGHEELAMGAIASGGIRILDQLLLIRATRISETIIDAVTVKERIELKRRELAYRGHRPALVVGEKTVILVDDGIATGSTMFAAVTALQERQPARIVVATPVAPKRNPARNCNRRWMNSSSSSSQTPFTRLATGTRCSAKHDQEVQKLLLDPGTH